MKDSWIVTSFYRDTQSRGQSRSSSPGGWGCGSEDSCINKCLCRAWKKLLISIGKLSLMYPRVCMLWSDSENVKLGKARYFEDISLTLTLMIFECGIIADTYSCFRMHSDPSGGSGEV